MSLEAHIRLGFDLQEWKTRVEIDLVHEGLVVGILKKTGIGWTLVSSDPRLPTGLFGEDLLTGLTFVKDLLDE